MVFSLVSAIPYLTHSQDLNPSEIEKIEKVIEPWNRANSPGVSCAVIRQGKLIFKKSAGVANLEYGIPLKSNSVFNIASTSKQFAAFAILLLEQDGKLSLDDKVDKYIPELPRWGQKITIRQLANHTSGIKEVFILFQLAGWNTHMDLISNRHALEMICRQKTLNFEPGTEYSYSNSGYFLLAEIVSRVSKQSFSRFTKERIFAPLKMKNSMFFENPFAIVHRRAYSYWPSNRGYKKLQMNHAAVGYTNLMTTVDDLCKWIENFETHQVGSRNLFSKFNAPGKLNDGSEIKMALGQFKNKYRGEVHFHHAGSTGGYRAHLVRFPNHKLSVVALTNADNISARNVVYSIVDIVLQGHLSKPGKAIALPRPQKDFDASKSIHNQYCGTYWIQDAKLVRQLKIKYGRLCYCRSVSDWDELLPVGKHLFRMRGREVFVEFKLNTTPPEVIVTDKSGRSRLKKIDNSVGHTKKLGKYVGEFKNTELPATYSLSIGKGCLVGRHYRGREIKLIPIKSDLFAIDQWYGGMIEFHRDANGAIQGFRFNQSRVRNLEFSKIRKTN